MRIKRTFCKVFYVMCATRGAGRATITLYLLYRAHPFGLFADRGSGVLFTPTGEWNGCDGLAHLPNALAP